MVPLKEKIVQRLRDLKNGLDRQRKGQTEKFKREKKIIEDEERSHQKLWSNADYERIDDVVQECLEEATQAIENLQSYAKTHNQRESLKEALALLDIARSHSSPRLRLVLLNLADAMWVANPSLESGVLCHGGINDPNIDHVSAKGSKLRIMEAIRKEAEILGVKEFESVLYYLDTVSSTMKETFHCVREKSGWEDVKGRQFGPVEK